MILQGEMYWRYFGRMGEAMHARILRMCERCEIEWQRRYGRAGEAA